ncbi:MAG: hypothetical protein JSV96_13050 [Candidatus Aminicenantes bacterium]|nr:MAG: hypothetical protein JSV96_13050 [Candidatus Aminicenantes bacterium]
MKYFDSYVDEMLYYDENIYASRTSLGIINQGKQPYILDNRFFSWIEGEFYNQEGLKSKHNIASETDNELFAKIYNSKRSFDFLRDIDGYYVAVLYDKKENKIYLITDRNGLKPLYWGKVNDDFVWSSELKGFLGHVDFKPVIDSQSVEEFFGIGYLLENRTLLEGVELVPPASVLTFDLKKSKVKSIHYWYWKDIKPIRGTIDEKELVEELGSLFKQSVRKRVKRKEKIGISLSGGLDSRAILAAVPEDYKPLHTFTFGQEGCDDIKIARKVSEIKGAAHHFCNISHENWLEQRTGNVWATDGNLNLLHMHASQCISLMKEFFDINLNGFAGDVVLGGSFLRANNLDKKIDSKIIYDVEEYEIQTENFKHWYMIDKTDPYFINNRERRFINSGTVLIAKEIEQRKPFFDNNLIELVYGIPDALRYKSYIYIKMLLNDFPQYYKNIPWKKTGFPIGWSKTRQFSVKVKNKISREIGRLIFKSPELRDYTDYPLWIRQDPAKSFFEKVLLSENALYSGYIDRNKIQDYVRDHMEKKADYHNELCLALTFELWLQQVFEGKYRDTKKKLLSL